MPRAYRNNVALSLGIITTHVSLTPAVVTEEQFKTVCLGHETALEPAHKTHAPSPIKQRQYCPVCDNDDKTTFLKARKEGDAFVVINDDELAEARGSEDVVNALKTSVTLGMHEATEVHMQTLPAKAGYYLKPANTKAAREGYALLVHILRTNPNLTLTGQWMPLTRANLYEITLFGDTLVMQERERTASVQVEAIDVSDDLNPQHVAMVGMVLSMLTTPFDPETYADDYMQRITALVASKDAVQGITPTGTGTAAKAAPVVDLTAALAQMAETAKKSPAPTKRKKSA